MGPLVRFLPWHEPRRPHHGRAGRRLPRARSRLRQQAVRHAARPRPADLHQRLRGNPGGRLACRRCRRPQPRPRGLWRGLRPLAHRQRVRRPVLELERPRRRVPGRRAAGDRLRCRDHPGRPGPAHPERRPRLPGLAGRRRAAVAAPWLAGGTAGPARVPEGALRGHAGRTRRDPPRGRARAQRPPGRTPGTAVGVAGRAGARGQLQLALSGELDHNFSAFASADYDFALDGRKGDGYGWRFGIRRMW
jgi:hypothetical protein